MVVAIAVAAEVLAAGGLDYQRCVEARAAQVEAASTQATVGAAVMVSGAVLAIFSGVGLGVAAAMNTPAEGYIWSGTGVGLGAVLALIGGGVFGDSSVGEAVAVECWVPAPAPPRRPAAPAPPGADDRAPPADDRPPEG